MKHILGDLLEGEWEIALHVANTMCVMGSGVAYFIKQKYPEVYQADLETEKDCDSKLGFFSKAEIGDNRWIYNLYAMCGLGNDGTPIHRNLSYDHLYNGLCRIVEDILTNHRPFGTTIGVPKFLGCCRAGGSWPIVECILYDIENNYPEIEFYVYELENAEQFAQSTQPPRYN